MHLKRYRSRTVRDALAMARADLGPSALVLSTRLVQAAGWRGWMGTREVEVTAAADRALSGSRPDAPSRTRPAPDAQAPIVARLAAAGLDRALAEDVAAALPDDRRRGASLLSLRQALADRLTPLAAGDEPYEPIEVFVGPPGAGKTTTIAKIAAQERARRGARLGLVAADGYRVGAVEQLRLYADIIGAPFSVARTPTDVTRVLAAGRPPLLVDTAGRSPRDASARELFDFLADRPGVRTHLVIPAGTGPREAERLFDLFRAVRLDRVVLTKLDETATLSPLVGVLRDRQLPISYLGTGQRVPEDLERATPPSLAARVLGEPPAAEARPS